MYRAGMVLWPIETLNLFAPGTPAAQHRELPGELPGVDVVCDVSGAGWHVLQKRTLLEGAVSPGLSLPRPTGRGCAEGREPLTRTHARYCTADHNSTAYRRRLARGLHQGVKWGLNPTNW